MKNAVISKAKWYIRCCSLVYLSISFSSVVHSAEDVSKMNSVAIAQQAKTRTVVGSVIDFETGEPIIGASVAVAGKSVGTISDLDGNFSIRVDGDNTKLEISFIGYEKQAVMVETGNLKTPQLYDMRVREYEKENLADQHPEIVYEMQNILRRVRK